jgi:hypothetical protein
VRLERVERDPDRRSEHEADPVGGGDDPRDGALLPATAPCSASGTASDAPAVKPGLVKPNPSEAIEKATVIP